MLAQRSELLPPYQYGLQFLQELKQIKELILAQRIAAQMV
jgi:hypothetical protein